MAIFRAMDLQSDGGLTGRMAVMEVVAMARWGRRWERQMAAVAAADVSAGWPADGMVPIGGMGAPPPTVKNDN